MKLHPDSKPTYPRMATILRASIAVVLVAIVVFFIYEFVLLFAQMASDILTLFRRSLP